MLSLVKNVMMVDKSLVLVCNIDKRILKKWKNKYLSCEFWEGCLLIGIIYEYSFL